LPKASPSFAKAREMAERTIYSDGDRSSCIADMRVSQFFLNKIWNKCSELILIELSVLYMQEGEDGRERQISQVPPEGDLRDLKGKALIRFPI
jgi:hypothetical protein